MGIQRTRISPTDASDLGLDQGDNAIEIRSLLANRGPIIVLTTIAGALLALIVGTAIRPVYESTTKILLMPKNGSYVASGNAADHEYAYSETRELLANHMEVITSPRIIASSLQEANLEELPSLVSAAENAELDIVSYVQSKLTVNRGGEGAAKDARVLRVSFRHDVAEDAAKVLDAILDGYQVFANSTVRSAGGEAAELLLEEIAKLDDEVKRTERAYEQLRLDAPVLWSEGEAQNRHIDRIVELESALADVEDRSREAKSRLTLVDRVLSPESLGSTTASQRFGVVAEDDIPRLMLLVDLQRFEPTDFKAQQPQRTEIARAKLDRLFQLRVELQAMSQRVGDRHPEVIELQQQVAELEQLINTEQPTLLAGTSDVFDVDTMLRAYRELLSTDLEDLTARKSEIKQRLDEEATLAKEVVQWELKGATLVASLERTRQLYDAKVQRLSEVNLSSDFDGFVTEVLTPATTGIQVWPKIPAMVALGVLAGGLLGCLLAIWSDYRDESFRNESDVRKSLRLPILCHVPQIRAARSAEVDKQLSADIVTLHQPDSIESEQFRCLRQSVLHNCQAYGQKIFQITSPVDGYGTSTVAANLAVSLARNGKRVLLVDGNSRYPAVGTRFGLAAEAKGLADLLSDTTLEPKDVVVSNVATRRLAVLPIGNVSAEFAEQMTSEQVTGVIKELSNDYDVVLIDSSPTLGFSETQAWARVSDAVLVVVKLDKDARRSTLDALQLLPEEKVIGTVLTGTDRRMYRANVRQSNSVFVRTPVNGATTSAPQNGRFNSEITT